MISEKLKSYRLVEQLGESGAQSQSYAAYRRADPRRVPVVMKLSSAEYVAQLRAEAKALKRFRHRGIVAMVEDFSFEEPAALVLEYVSGLSAREWLERKPPAIPEPVLVNLASQIAEALANLHEHLAPETGGLLPHAHGDVSPANLLFGFSGRVKLLDFGLTRAQDLQGRNDMRVEVATLRYASPGRVQDRRLDVRDDVFALGLILWELATGAGYWSGCEHEEIIRRLADFAARDPREKRPNLSEAFVKIVKLCLTVEGFAGFQSAGEVKQALERLPRATEAEVAAFLREHARWAFQREQDRLTRWRTIATEIVIPDIPQAQSPSSASGEPLSADNDTDTEASFAADEPVWAWLRPLSLAAQFWRQALTVLVLGELAVLAMALHLRPGLQDGLLQLNPVRVVRYAHQQLWFTYKDRISRAPAAPGEPRELVIDLRPRDGRLSLDGQEVSGPFPRRVSRPPHGGLSLVRASAQNFPDKFMLVEEETRELQIDFFLGRTETR